MEGNYLLPDETPEAAREFKRQRDELLEALQAAQSLYRQTIVKLKNVRDGASTDLDIGDYLDSIAEEYSAVERKANAAIAKCTGGQS